MDIQKKGPGNRAFAFQRDELACGDFAVHDADTGNVAHPPLCDGCLVPAIEAGGRFKSCGTLRADSAGLEGVELRIALVATPDWTNRGIGPATGAGETLAARDFLEVAQSARGFEAAPAVHSGVGGDQARPYGLSLECKQQQRRDSKESEKRGNQQAARSAQRKPEQGAQDLSAIEWVNGQDVEDEQNEIPAEQCRYQLLHIWHRGLPLQRIARPVRNS